MSAEKVEVTRFTHFYTRPNGNPTSVQVVAAADYDALEKERDSLRAALLPFLTSSGLFSPNIEDHVPPEVAHHLRALEAVLRAALKENT